MEMIQNQRPAVAGVEVFCKTEPSLSRNRFRSVLSLKMKKETPKFNPPPLRKRLGISQHTASQLVKRGEKIVKVKQLKVMG